MLKATADMETYSAAGNVWDAEKQKWVVPAGAASKKRGISVVSAHAYAEHPSTEILLMRYRLPGGPVQRWTQGDPPPWDLLRWLAGGGLIEFHNAFFERAMWHYVAHLRLGWPPLPFHQVRCSQAKARVNTFPPALGQLAKTLGVQLKDDEGARLINKFSVPQNPTKKQPFPRIFPWDDLEDFERFGVYCEGDVESEEQCSDHPRMAAMSEDEEAFWLVDQEINWRGLGVDLKGVEDCIAVYEQVRDKLFPECAALTGGLSPTQVSALVGWCAGRGQPIPSLAEEDVEAALRRPLLPPDVRRVLEIRQAVGSASVKKLYAMRHTTNTDGRLRGLMLHHGARTGRPTGAGAQPLNMPKAGPDVYWCESCGEQDANAGRCHHCLELRETPEARKKREWPGKDGEAATSALKVMARRDPGLLTDFYGDPVLTIQGCLRSLFWASEGNRLIASDYSSIEAVVTAMMAGEQWRIDAFLADEPMYLVSASKITGTPVSEYLRYAKEQGKHHPDRQIGKVAELALGYGGWINAWLNFDKSGQFDEAEIRKIILRWRDESPAIVEFWGGQSRGKPWDPFVEDLHGVEGMFVQALKQPGAPQFFRGLTFCYHPDVDKLLITLPSGRDLTYRTPRLTPDPDRGGQQIITYWTYNTNVKYGSIGEVCMKTYGGKLAENIIQAIAHDILRHGIRLLKAAGYPTVLHVYDEIIVEVPAGTGTVEEVERLMATMPWWARGWPIRASGGWAGRRYRKG